MSQSRPRQSSDAAGPVRARRRPSRRRRGHSVGRPQSPLRWVRRLLALSCLVMAGVSAVRESAVPTPRGAPVTPAPGQRVVPVTVVGADVGAYIRSGDVVELLASSADDAGLGTGTDPPGSVTVLSSRATVLTVQRLDGGAVGGQGWQLVVAVDEPAARRIADVRGQQVLAVGGRSP